ncbi:hypothetical protein DFJ73DRAFT_949867 [Zopfochytrium polystomum]|nr:hypothetical protein DFJ73DRAFT_949867 [Zopfochytrium polystomum]
MLRMLAALRLAAVGGTMRVLIVGAGVGGPVLALALKRGGHTPILVDKFDPAAASSAAPATTNHPFDFGDVGGGFSLLHGSLRFLRDLDLLEPIRDAAFNRTSTLVWSRMDGTPICHWDVVAHKYEPDLRHTAQMLRSTLHRIVMTRISQQGIAVVAHFADGSSIEADLLVGADGIHSAVRRAVFGAHLKARPFGMGGHLGVSSWDADAGFPDDVGAYFMTHIALRKRLVIMRISDTQCFWNLTEFGPGADGGSGSASPQSTRSSDDGGDPAAWRPTPPESLPGEVGRLAELVAEWGAPKRVVDLVARSHRLTPLAIYDAPKLDSFSSGRVVLIGDSAHGMPPHRGQGLSLAYGDAAVLAELLSRFPDDHERALAIYNKLRVPIAHDAVEKTHKFAEQTFPATTFGKVAGHLAIKMASVLSNSFNLVTTMSSNYKEDVDKALAEPSK